MEKSYKEYIQIKKLEYGRKFDDSDLNKQFIPYFETQERVEVDFGYEKKRGTIGIATGRKPSFLLMLTSRSRGSSYTIGKEDKITKII